MTTTKATESNRPKLIQVVGLGHSGTTLLDAVLGCAPEIVGVGEALRTLDHTVTPNGPYFTALRNGEFDKALCSCGNTVAQCPLWRGLGPELTGAKNQDLATILSALSEAALRLSPRVEFILDSTPAGLSYSNALAEHFDVRLVHIVRDIRSWGLSQARRRKTRLDRAYSKWLKQIPEQCAKIEASGLPYMRIGYEELAIVPDKTLRALTEWLGVTYTDDMLTPGLVTQSHIINGNAVFLKGKRDAAIRYDADWMTKPTFDLRAIWMLRKASKLNQDLVYGNGVLQRPPK